MRDAPVIRASLSTLPDQTVKTTHQFCCRTLVSRIPAKPPSHAAHGILAVPLNRFVLSLLQFSRRIHVSGPCSCPLPPFIMLYCLCLHLFSIFFCFLSISGYTPYVFQAWRRTSCGFCILFYPLIMSRFCFFSLPSHTHQKRFEENMGNLMLAYLCFAFTKPGGHS